MPIIVDKNKKRTDILQAAMRIFARAGYHRAKMESIAAEARIGKGTVYEYFRSKTDLFLALHQHMLGELKAFYRKELEGISQPALILERFIAAAFQTFHLCEPFSLVFFDFWAEGGRGEQQNLLKTRLRNAYETSRIDVAAMIASGVKDGTFHCANPLLTAARLMATLDGLLLQWLCDRDAFDLDRMRDDLTQATLRSLRQ